MSYKFNENAQISFFYVKIGLWILTTNFTKTVVEKEGEIWD